MLGRLITTLADGARLGTGGRCNAQGGGRERRPATWWNVLGGTDDNAFAIRTGFFCETNHSRRYHSGFLVLGEQVPRLAKRYERTSRYQNSHLRSGLALGKIFAQQQA